MRSRGAARPQMTLLILAILPFWSNYLIRTYSWMVLLNREGLVNNALEAGGVISQPLPLLYNEFAIILGLVYAYLPFMILALYASISRLPGDLLEASSDLGQAAFVPSCASCCPHPARHRRRLRVRLRALARQFRHAGPARGKQTTMIGNVIYAQFFTARDWPFGSALAFVLVAVMMALLMAQAILVRRQTSEAS